MHLRRSVIGNLCLYLYYDLHLDMNTCRVVPCEVAPAKSKSCCTRTHTTKPDERLHASAGVSVQLVFGSVRHCRPGLGCSGSSVLQAPESLD